jgi:hypothetical protein
MLWAVEASPRSQAESVPYRGRTMNQYRPFGVMLLARFAALSALVALLPSVVVGALFPTYSLMPGTREAFHLA